MPLQRLTFSGAAVLFCLAAAGCSAKEATGGTTESEPSLVADASAADAACIEVPCGPGTHWNASLCRCVICIQNVLCVSTAHFDLVLCRCVLNDAGAPDAETGGRDASCSGD
jgi:hypothetical protein